METLDQLAGSVFDFTLVDGEEGDAAARSRTVRGRLLGMLSEDALLLDKVPGTPGQVILNLSHVCSAIERCRRSDQFEPPSLPSLAKLLCTLEGAEIRLRTVGPKSFLVPLQNVLTKGPLSLRVGRNDATGLFFWRTITLIMEPERAGVGAGGAANESNSPDGPEGDGPAGVPAPIQPSSPPALEAGAAADVSP